MAFTFLKSCLKKDLYATETMTPKAENIYYPALYGGLPTPKIQEIKILKGDRDPFVET